MAAHLQSEPRAVGIGFLARQVVIVVANDLDRDDTRCFRLSRIHDDVKLVGPQDSFTVPEGIDITESVEMLAQPAPSRAAHLRIRPGSAVPLRRRGTVLNDGADWTHVGIGFDDVEQLAAEICGYGPRVVVDEPDDLRDAVVRRVRSVLEAVSA